MSVLTANEHVQGLRFTSMGRCSAIWVSIMVTGLVVAACSGGAQPASPRDTDAPGPTRAPSADPSRLRVSTSGWKTDFSKASVDLGEFLGGGPPKDGIPAIDAPKHESIDDARDWLEGRSPVISLEVGGEARAYPLAVLIWHEIANDTLGGVPIVVTFCPMCNTALVFERELDGVVHDFGTTGNLRGRLGGCSFNHSMTPFTAAPGSRVAYGLPYSSTPFTIPP